MIASRSLDDLLPVAKLKAMMLKNACAQKGIDLLIYCTYRDAECQDSLYAQGRTTPGAIVTNARAGDSWHNYKLAWDCVPLVGGKPAWGDSALYLQVGKLGEDLGIEWAGRWSGKLKETAHFQFTGGLSLAQLKAGKLP